MSKEEHSRNVGRDKNVILIYHLNINAKAFVEKWNKKHLWFTQLLLPIFRFNYQTQKCRIYLCCGLFGRKSYLMRFCK